MRAATAIASAVLTVGDDRPRVVGVDVAGAGGSRRIAADIVVSAADLHHTETGCSRPSTARIRSAGGMRGTPVPGAVLVLLGVTGELPALAHHSLFFTADWRGDFGRIFGDPSSVPDPASLYVCRPSATDAGVAPDGAENLFVLVPVPADPAIGFGGLDGGGSPQVEAIADAAIDQVAALGGHPRPAGAHRRAPHHRPGRFRTRPQRLEGRRPRTGAHAAAECLLPRSATHRRASAASITRAGAPSRESGCRCA